MSADSIRKFAIVLLISALASPLCADDGAVSVAMGGIRPRKEVRISMENERLMISEHEVTVDFDFLNETDTDVTTEVGFPIPTYCSDVNSRQEEEFDDFRVWVNGREFKYQTGAKALVRDKDYAALLGNLGIDVDDFGDFDWDHLSSPQVARVSPTDKATLTRLGLLDKNAIPSWCVDKLYHWNQTFPAHKTIHIRHEYTPAIGFGVIEFGELQIAHKDMCLDDRVADRLKGGAEKGLKSGITHEAYVYPTWVDYILTSANTWKTPIKSFELVVERPKPDKRGSYYVSFCWDGKVERPDADHFIARAIDFVPARELRIYFLLSE
jgi:Domain of unknown function (DUF4424)